MTVDIATLAIRIDSLEARAAARDLDRVGSASGRAEQATSGLEAATRKLQGALALLGLGAGLGAIIRMADEYTKTTAQLRLATESQRQYAIALEDVRRISNTAQQDLAATGVLYARIANGTRELGVAQRQVAAITEVVNLALKVSGATAAESSSAMLQLSQSFASGTLRGEEFNAVNEAAPRLMKALADGIGVPVGALKKMAEEGAITSKIMADVLPNALLKLQEEAKQVQTISGAFTVLKNKIMEFTGVQAQASGFVSVLTSAIGALADNLALLMGVVGTVITAKIATSLAAWTASTYATVAANRALLVSNVAAAESEVAAAIAADRVAAARVLELRAAVLAAEGNVALAITTNGLIPAELNATRAAAALAAANNGLAAATGAASVSAGVLRGALAFFGGPIGALITALGLAATAWMVWGNKAKESNKQAAESFDEAQARIVKGLDEQIAKNEKLIQLQGLGMTKKAIDRDLPAIEQLAAASKRLNDINNRTGEFAPEKGKSNDDALFARVKVMKDIAELTEKMQKRASTDDAAAAFGPAAQALVTVRERLTGVNKQYLDDLKALSTAREANAIPEKEYIALVTKLAQETWKASDAGKDLAANSKAQIEARLETIKSGIEREKAMRAESVATITELNRQGIASDDELFKAKYDAVLKAGQDSVKVYDAEIAALSAYNGKDEAERIANNAKIQKLNTDRNEALRSSLVSAAQMRVAYEYDADKPVRDAEAANTKGLVAINDQIDAVQRQIAAYGKLPSAITEATIAQMEGEKAAVGVFEGSEVAVAAIEAKIQAYKRLAAEQKTLQGLDDGTDVAKAERLLKILESVDAAARQAAQGMADSFGRVGSAIGGLTTALSGYAVQQQAIAAQLAAVKADPKSSAQKIAQAEIAASKASAQAQIKSYGDMAGAAKGFFKENTAGYKVLQTTEKAFRAYEMAMALESMVKKIFFKEGEVAANVALNATKITGEATATGASVALAGTEASAWGITAVVKAMASLPFPLNLAAGAATLAAVVAIGAKMMGGGGGGGFDVAKDRQEKAGTGSILGDESAKSDSLGRSIENLEKYASVELSHTRDMLSALVKIRDTIGVVAAMASQTAGLRATALDEKKYGVGSSSGVLGIGASSTTIQDSGIKLNGSQTIGSAIASGVDATGYADILKKKSGFFGIGSSSKTSRDVIQLDDDLKKQFGLLVGSMRDGAVEAVKLLGVSADGIVEKINGMALGIDEISFKGLTGEEIEEQLQAVFSNVGDDIAKLAAPELTQFQQVGEGYLETLTRIATNYATLDSIMESSGVGFGAVGLSSIAARENLIKLTGGLDALISSTESFNDNFLSEAERLAPVQKYVTDQLAAMGLQSLDTRDKFKEYVLGLANSGKLATDAGAQQYASLLALADAFAKTHAATVDLTKSEQAIADERKDLQDKLDELTMTQEQLAKKARDAISGHNLALYDQVIAAQAAKEAAQALADQATALLGEVDSAFAVLQRVVEREKAAKAEAHAAEMKALQVRIDASTSSIAKLKSLSDTLKSSLDSMTVSGTGDSDARTVGQAQIQAALAIAKAGGPLPSADSLKQALSSVTKDASDQFATYDDYLSDFYKTQNDIAALGKVSDAALSVEQKTLDLLQAQKDASQLAYDAEVARLNEIVETARSQIDVLKGMDTSLLTIDQSLQAVLGAIMKAQANSSISSNAAIVKSYQENLGRNPDKAGLEFYQQQAAAGTSIGSIDAAIKNSGEAQIQSLYKNLLGRNADAGGLKYWLDSLNSGASLANIEAAIKLDAEYKKLHPLAVGTNYVPRDMPALIHEGERVIPKADNVELMNRLRSPATDNNAELLAELRELRREVAETRGMQESHLYAIAKSAKNTEDFLDGAINGDTPIAVKEPETVG